MAWRCRGGRGFTRQLVSFDWLGFGESESAAEWTTTHRCKRFVCSKACWTISLAPLQPVTWFCRTQCQLASPAGGVLESVGKAHSGLHRPGGPLPP